MELFCRKCGDIDRNCYECEKNYGKICDECMVEYDIVKNFIIPNTDIILCAECFQHFQHSNFGHCVSCKNIFEKEELINDEMSNGNDQLYCLNCDESKIQKFNNIDCFE